MSSSAVRTSSPQRQTSNHDSLETKIRSSRRRPSVRLGLLGAIALFLVLGPGLNGISGSSYAQTEALPVSDQAPTSRQNVLSTPLQLNPTDNDDYNRQLVQSMDEQDMGMARLLQQQQQQQQQQAHEGDATLQLYRDRSHHQHKSEKQQPKNAATSHRASGLKLDKQHWDFVHLASKVSGKSDHRVNQRLRHEWELQESRSRRALAKKANQIKNSRQVRGSKDVSRQEQQSAKPKQAIKAKNAAHGEAKPEVKKQGFNVQGVIKGPKTSPAIFYVPHQDDDALAMALAIREHIESGRRVIVHLYSDGINAMLRDIVAGAVPCPLRHPPHRFNLTLSDVVTGRTHEFRQSLRALGVQAQDIYETGWSDIEPLKDYAAFKLKLRDLIVGYEQKYPGASHKCISGEYDRDAVGRNPTHRACWDVATDLLNEFPRGYPMSNQLWDFRFYRTYTYYNPPTRRSAQFIRALPRYLPYKQHALDQYKRWDPSRGELAWGYHSVKSLIDAAYNDVHVYMDMLDNDPTNPDNWSSEARNRAEWETVNTQGETTMFPDPMDHLEKDTNIMLFRAGSKMAKKPMKHPKSHSQRKGWHAQSHGRSSGGAKGNERMEEDVEETHIFGDYDIDISGLEAQMGGQSMDTNAYDDHDLGEGGANAAAKDTDLKLLKESSKKKTLKKHGKSPSQKKKSGAQGHGGSAKGNERMEEDVEETHIFGDYDIDMSGLEAQMGGQSVDTNAYDDHDLGEAGANAAAKDTDLKLLKESSKKKTLKKHGKKISGAQRHGGSAKGNGRMEQQDAEETHVFGDYDIDMSGLEAQMGGQSVDTNAYEGHDDGEGDLEAILAIQRVKETHGYGDYNIDDDEIMALLASQRKESTAYHDQDIKEEKIAVAPENLILMAKQPGPAASTLARPKSDDQHQMELNEGRSKDQILKAFDAATQRPEGQDYKNLNPKRGSPIVLGLVKSDPLE
ncbi:unnamed protein product [Mortierella alpina]